MFRGSYRGSKTPYSNISKIVKKYLQQMLVQPATYFARSMILLFLYTLRTPFSRTTSERVLFIFSPMIA